MSKKEINDELTKLDEEFFAIMADDLNKIEDVFDLAAFSNSLDNFSENLLSELEEEKEPINPIVKETLEILDTLEYRYNGIKVKFPSYYDYSAVEVLTPQNGSEILREKLTQYPQKPKCNYSVTNQDSFEAASKFDYPMVMNFANAYEPGGGFVGGSIAQEECLCRNSTLYNSISSEKAAEMYEYNIKVDKPLVTDYMLYSPNVVVFRDKNGELLKRPFLVATTTTPAPNRMREAMFEKDAAVNGTIKRRIRIMLRNAIKHGHDSVVLGAWGCGVFGNEPKDVANCFRDVLVKEGYDKYFSNVNFAIFGKEDSENILAFKDVFAKEIGLDRSKLPHVQENNKKPTRNYSTKAKRINKTNNRRVAKGKLNSTIEHDGR